MTDNVTLVREAYDGFARGDVGPLVAILDENVEWNEAEHGPYWPAGAHHGPQAVLDGVIAAIMRDFDGFRIDVVRLSAAGDTVLAEARYGGTAKATGRSLDAQVAHVWDFADGKVVKWQQYTDTWQFAQVTGTEPKQ